MPIRIAGFACLLALIGLSLFPQTASASTHLLIPRFTSLPEDNSYLEVSNGNDHEVWFELRAFSSSGQPLGVSRISADAHSARRVLLRNVFAFDDGLMRGWIDAFAAADDVILTLHPGLMNGQIEAFRPEESLVVPVGYLNRPLIWVANANRFPVNFTATAYDAQGERLGEHQMAVGDSAQLAVPVNDLWQADVATVTIAANGELAAMAEEDQQEPVQAKEAAKDIPEMFAATSAATPVLRSVFPRSDFIRRTFPMTLTGRGLDGVTGLRFVKDDNIDDGIKADITSKTVTVLGATVEITFAASVGVHKVVLVTSTGSTLTTAISFSILGPQPEVNGQFPDPR